MVKVKICCISSLEEANLAISLGASAIGLVSEMPSGPGVINEDLITEIAGNVPRNIETFLLTSKQSAEEIILQVKKCNTTTVQIVDDLIYGTYLDIKTALPNVKIVQVVHVENETTIKKAIEVAKYIDAILLDSGNQKLTVKELGGTGRTHDWSLSKEIVAKVSVPVYLAGGLNSNNVVDAINTVHPYGVDLCSGVRTDDQLDKIKLTEFFNSIRNIAE
ncbi:MAG: phosphoribosylanthranilate isomerase [Melioribacteraceae bacterium]|nr:phosphoribosylanthranilate isomerase [Melioribacteraceae bacterium]